jgi:hypothetical protein
VRAEIEEKAEDYDEPLEAGDVVGPGRPHHRVGKRRPGEQEEPEDGNEPRVVGAAEDVGEEPEPDQREARRKEREEGDQAADGRNLSSRPEVADQRSP